MFGLPLAVAVLRRPRLEMAVVSVGTALPSGVGIWLFGEANSIHAGFSGVLYGYLGYLVVVRRAEARHGEPVPGLLTLAPMLAMR